MSQQRCTNCGGLFLSHEDHACTAKPKVPSLEGSDLLAKMEILAQRIQATETEADLNVCSRCGTQFAAPTQEAAGLGELTPERVTEARRFMLIAREVPITDPTPERTAMNDRINATILAALYAFSATSRARAPEGTWTAEDAKDIAVAVAYAANHYASKDHAMRLMHLAERIDAAALWQITEGEHGSAVRSGAPGAT